MIEQALYEALQDIYEDIEREMYEDGYYDEYPEEDGVEYPVIDEGEDVEDTLPTHLGIRKSLLKANGRRKGLKNLWNSHRFDNPWVRSRDVAHSCHKDDSTYRPWQRDHMKTIRGVPDNDWNDYQDFVEGVLQSEYKNSEVLVEEGVF